MGLFDIITSTGKLASIQRKTFRNTPQVTDPLWLPVKGSIPTWLNGILYRVGPGKYNLGPDESDPQYVIRHAFDGLTLVHRFEVSASRQSVRYNSRMTAEDKERSLVQGEMPGPFFGHVHEGESSWNRLKTTLARVDAMVLRRNDSRSNSASSHSVGVTTTPNYPLPARGDFDQKDGAHVLVSKTDANILQKLHHDTLVPERVFNYQSYDDNLNGNISAAHHQYDPETGEIFNFTINFGRTPSMTVFSISKTGKVTILAKITHRLLPNGAGRVPFNPSYIHSFWLTKDYVILPESPLYYSNHGLDLVFSGTVIGGLAWQENAQTYLHVISRDPSKGGHIVSVPTDPFFTFHTANGFSEKDEQGNTTLHLDCCAFANGDVVYAVHGYGAVDERNGSSNNVGKKKDKFRGLSLDEDNAIHYANLVRYSVFLPMDDIRKDAKVTHRVLTENMEFPRFSQKNTIKPYRYVWGCQQMGDNHEYTGLVKVDLETGETIKFALDNCVCSEPIFVPKDMKSTDAPEDQGALLSFVNVPESAKKDGSSSSSNCFLIILDAATMQELARCDIGNFNATTFHGSFVDMEFQSVSLN